jgi:radical SAM protein with 4Fe4S-binding SPASM domain
VRAQCDTAYACVADLYLEAYRQKQPFWVSLLDGKIASYIKGGYLEGDRCDLGQRNLVVAASGRLYPCDRLVGEDRDDTRAIGDVWRGPNEERIRRLVSQVTSPGECGECALASRCRNRCACANLAMTGTIDVPSETLCLHEQLAIRAADRAAQSLFAERNPLFLAQHYRAVSC